MREAHCECRPRGGGRSALLIDGNRRVDQFKRAQLIFLGGHCSMTAEVFDMSETGAQLAPLDPFLCPKQFKLALRQEQTRCCEVVWRRGARVGIRYL